MSKVASKEVLVKAMTEDQLLNAVIGAAMMQNWLAHHTRPAWSEKGWRTPIQGSPGFFDLVLARGGHIIIAELKSERGNLSKDQRAWSHAVGKPQSVRKVLWRPQNWVSGEIWEELE